MMDVVDTVVEDGKVVLGKVVLGKVVVAEATVVDAVVEAKVVVVEESVALDKCILRPDTSGVLLLMRIGCVVVLYPGALTTNSYVPCDSTIQQ